MPTRIAYIAHTRFPTEKAHGNQMANVCGALAELGHEVTLMAPKIRTIEVDDPYVYYGVKKSFVIRHLPVFSALEKWYVPGSVAFLVTMRSYAKALTNYLSKNKPDLLYVRSPLLLHPLLQTGIPLILELHSLPQRRQAFFVERAKQCRLIVCLTSLQKKELIAMGVPERKILVEPDGVNLTMFSSTHDRPMSKEQVIGYFGSRFTQDKLSKGVEIFEQAIAMLQARGMHVTATIVDGSEDKPKIAPALVPAALAANDILVYPAPQSNHPFFQRDTSPLKLYEYLAAKRSVVCAELPPLHDMVSEKEVTFCRPGDPTDMADKITWVLHHPVEAQEKVKAGFTRVQDHTWEKRMARILAFAGVAK